MAYLGRQPIIGNYQVLDPITATTTDTYALTKNSVAVFPQTPANCIVSLNGVIQAPVDSYTISGSNIVFASALTASDSIDFITVLGDVLNVGTVSDGTIGLAKLSATGTKDATTFLRGDNTFASPGFTLATPVTASGTSITFTGIPSTARMIVIGTDGLSFTGAGNPNLKIELGDSGGIETTGYKATAVYLSTNTGEASPGGAGYTDAFVANYQPDQSSSIHCQMILTCLNSSTNTWNFSNLASAYSAGYIQCGAGVKSLSDTLTQIKISYSGGQSFDAGTINIMYQ